jgi:hypothetical protein
MTVLRAIVLMTVLLTMVAGGSFVVLAGQVPPLARVGNVWNGKNHEPSPGVVEGRESAKGVVPPPAQQQQETQTVETQANQLTRKAQQGEAMPSASLGR